MVGRVSPVVVSGLRVDGGGASVSAAWFDSGPGQLCQVELVVSVTMARLGISDFKPVFVAPR